MNTGLAILYLLSLGTLLVTEAKSVTSRRNVETRIIGGQPARAGQFKFAAAIHVQTTDSTFFCGGALTGNQWIITSGHCVHNAVIFTIQLGSHTLNDDDDNRVLLSTSDYYLHPDFDPAAINNDIAIIHLRMAVMLNGYIQPIYTSSMHHDDTETITLGFGQVSDVNGELSNQLMYVDVTTVTNEECRLYYGNQITDNMICAIGNYNEGTCTGDMGGPLVQPAERNNYLLVGVASFISGNGCESTEPSGYTRVRPYLDWIHTITGRYNDTLV